MSFIVLLLWVTTGKAQQVIPLYEGVIRGSIAVTDQERWTPNELVDTVVTGVSSPTLSVFTPPSGKANGTAVIICPGGGYHALLISREGHQVAKALNQAGIIAFVLKYRLPDGRIMKDKTTGPLQDAQQAVKLVRKHAALWQIKPHKIGIMGFSAGGHLAALTGTHFNRPLIENPENISLRPDFMLLINPVISFTDSIGHQGSRDNLLGPSPTEHLIRQYSAELQANERTPPAFLVHTSGDKVVPAVNSLYFYEALRKHRIPAELHLYNKGEHGFLTAPPFEEWFGRCLYWLKSMGFNAG